MKQPGVMWFRQDLRLSDNSAFSAAAAAGPLVCLYVLDDETPGKWAWGGASRWWLHKSLESLEAQLAGLGLKLILRRGPADRVIDQLLVESAADNLFFTRGYAPWEPALEQRIRVAAVQRGVICHRYGGFLLHEPEAIRTREDKPFQVFTPYSRACLACGAPRTPKPAPGAVTAWTGILETDRLRDWNLPPSKPNWAEAFAWDPGEKSAHLRLTHFIETSLKGYVDDRDRPDRDGTSCLSPHLHWGEVSAIQCWNAVTSHAARCNGGMDRSAEKFLLELLWREFSYHLLHHWPDLPDRSFQEKFQTMIWRDDPIGLYAWQRGETGIPIVDAGMRQLWTTGYMHNRVRMIAASFLIKDLLIDWREGERWFWDTLIDADIANNAASWQWVAGSGADAAPYFRIFNPSLQSERFDPAGTYIRKWLPELMAVPDKWIHRPWQAPQIELEKAGVRIGQDYPCAIVGHAFARKRALDAFGYMRGLSAF